MNVFGLEIIEFVRGSASDDTVGEVGDHLEQGPEISLQTSSRKS
jgi:hypothetical protein